MVAVTDRSLGVKMVKKDVTRCGRLVRMGWERKGWAMLDEGEGPKTCMSASAAAQQLILEKQPPKRAGMQGGSPACPHRQQHSM